MKNASCGPRDAIGQVQPETNRLPRSSEIRWEGISGALSIEARLGKFAGRGRRRSVPWKLKEHGMEQRQGDQLLSEHRVSGLPLKGARRRGDGPAASEGACHCGVDK